VTKAEDKQKLFRVIKAVNQDWADGSKGNKRPLQVTPCPDAEDGGHKRDSFAAEVGLLLAFC